MFVKKKTFRLDGFEEDIVIKSLNRVRTDRQQNNVCDKDVSKLMLKILQTPEKKVRRRNEAR